MSKEIVDRSLIISTPIRELFFYCNAWALFSHSLDIHMFKNYIIFGNFMDINSRLEKVIKSKDNYVYVRVSMDPMTKLYRAYVTLKVRNRVATLLQGLFVEMMSWKRRCHPQNLSIKQFNFLRENRNMFTLT